MGVDVLFLSRFNAFCGVSTYTEQLATALSKKQVDVGALSSDFKIRCEDTDIPCVVGWTEDGGLTDAIETVLELDPKIIHIQHEHGIFKDTIALSTLCDEIKKKTSAKLVLTAHTVSTVLPRPGHDFGRLMRRMDAIIVHSRLCREIVSRYPNIKDPERVHFIPHGMLDFVAPMDRNEACKKLGLNSSKKVFRLLSMGFISNPKRHMVMLQIAMTIVKHERLAPREFELVIAGQPADDAKALPELLKKAARSFDIEKNVHIFSKFIPFEQFKYYYGSADMAVHMVKPSYLAASGSMRTDLSHAMPIIAMQGNMTLDLNGGVLKVGSTDEMITRLFQLSRDNKTLSLLRKQAEHFARDHNWSIVATQHLKLYENLCGKAIMNRRQGVRSALFHSSPWLLGSSI